MSITNLVLPAWARWVAFVGIFAAGTWCGAHLDANVKNVEIAQAKTAHAELRADVAKTGAEAAGKALAVTVHQNQITNEVDHDYQKRRTALVARLAGDGLRDKSAAASCSDVPAAADDSGQPDAAPADVVSGAAGSAPETIAQCRLTTLQLLDLQAAVVRLGLAPHVAD